MEAFDPYRPPLDGFDRSGPGAGDTEEGRHTDRMVAHLKGTRPWVLFLAVLMFLGAAFMVLGGIAFALTGALGARGLVGPAEAVGAGMVYLVGGAVYFLFGYLMYRYTSAIGRLVVSNRTVDIEDALDAQRVFWKASGITAVVMIAIMVMVVVAGIIAGIAAAMG
ncbi:MAG: hypothetical protein JRI68_11030 [Deltaproteobacteria bacterium]|nr:hypothetical protein [Deltaproteobacteria bacterium]